MKAENFCYQIRKTFLEKLFRVFVIFDKIEGEERR